MKIRKANSNDVIESLTIAGDLREWFTKPALLKMGKDFKENLIVGFDKKVVGFLNYKINKKYIRILWIGIDRKNRRNGIGKILLIELEKIAKNLDIKKIIVNTLSYQDEYEPYISTRNFYLKNGFIYGEILSKKNEDEQVEMVKIL
jgi:N-acetylglutamate synthase-like GNAT family acetyltransferase